MFKTITLFAVVAVCSVNFIPQAHADRLFPIDDISSRRLGFVGQVIGNSRGDRAILVDAIQPGSPAETMGLEVRDYILEINNVVPTSQRELFRAVNSRYGKVFMKIRRGRLSGTLRGDVGQISQGPPFAQGPNPFGGPIVQTVYRPVSRPVAAPSLDVQVGSYRGRFGDFLQIERVGRGGLGDLNGLQAGDVILQVNGQDVTTLGDYEQAIFGARSIRLEIQSQDGRFRTVVIR